MDFYFATEQDEHCASTSSRNDEMSTDNSTKGSLDRLDEAHASPEYTVFSSVSNPALLTPPATSNATVRHAPKINTLYRL
jgi:hypothetical protein